MARPRLVQGMISMDCAHNIDLNELACDWYVEGNTVSELEPACREHAKLHGYENIRGTRVLSFTEV